MPEPIFKAFRGGNPANRSDVEPLKIIEGKTLILVKMPQIKGFMGAFNDLGRPIVFSNSRDQVVVRFPIALGNEDIVSALQIFGWFAQRTSRQKILVSKWRLAIDQYDIQPMFEV